MSTPSQGKGVSSTVLIVVIVLGALLIAGCVLVIVRIRRRAPDK